jgi:hypothetical protein
MFHTQHPAKTVNLSERKADICSENGGKFSSGMLFPHGAILNPNRRAVN